MKRIFIIILIAISIVTIQAKISIKHISDSEIIINYITDDLNIYTDDQFTSVSINDHDVLESQGMPALPIKNYLIAVPLNSKLEISLSNIKTIIKNITKPVIPAYEIIKAGKTHDFLRKIDPQKYNSVKLQKAIEVKDLEKWRYNYYHSLTINPINYDFENSKLTITEKMEIRIKIVGDTDFQHSIYDETNKIVNKMFLNPQSALKWQIQDKTDIAHIPLEKSDFWYKIELENSNRINVITFNDLNILPDFVEVAQLRMLTLLKNNISNNFELKELPLHIDQINEKIYFSIDDGENIPHLTWLTFGGNFSNAPLRVNEFLQKNSARDIISIEKYLKPSIKGRDEQIDCLIIAPEVFMEQANYLAQFHTVNDGISCLVTDQMDIVTQFGDESADPLSIEQYIRYLFENMPTPALQYVILLGSGTDNYDYSISLEDWYSQKQKNKILVNSIQDDNYVILYNGSSPDISIGRIPAQTTYELNLQISRIEEYAQNPNYGWWRNKVLLLADDELKATNASGYEGIGGSPNDTAGMNHSKRVVQMEEALDPEIFVEKIFAFNYGLDEFNTKPGVTDEIVEKVNEGALIWYYIGHGNHDVLGDEEYFRGSVHSNYLQNYDKLNLFIAASCSVGEFFLDEDECIATKFLFLEDGGSIATVAASSGCGPVANTTLMKSFIVNMLNNANGKQTIGMALLNAKAENSNYSTNNKLYHIFGDPILKITTPNIQGKIEFQNTEIADTLHARQTVNAQGNFELNNTLNTQVELRVFDTSIEKTYINYNYSKTIAATDSTFYFTVNYPENGISYYRSTTNIINDEYDFSFIIPDDIHNGENGRIINYIADIQNNVEYVNCITSINYSKDALDVQSTDVPQISLWLDSKTFLHGDNVCSNPTLICRISDENGINISGSPGRKILLLIDNSQNQEDLIDVTESFVYDQNSYTAGELKWQLNNLSEGQHSIQLFAYDNFGDWSVAETSFITKKIGDITISDMLPYPNPMEKEGYFTFVITEPADVTLNIYTITGKKIRSIKKFACNANYNEIQWNGKDQDGDYLANNTYFYKLKAKSLISNKSVEEKGTFVIYH
ncbi:MAG: hypothetical protein K8S23_01160 [Candidatus Cloacimonetes bacterium]|nr:hypothetical protein [Candidatus Cloacimonadota bacterium]